jgi:hypothetical protein
LAPAVAVGVGYNLVNLVVGGVLAGRGSSPRPGRGVVVA